MILRWLRERRRKKIRSKAFPKKWKIYISKNVAHFHRLSKDDQAKLIQLTQVFIAEKNWEGCGGLELTDEIKVTIAAQACLMILKIPHNYYENVDSILVYPSTVMSPERELGVFEIAQEPRGKATPIIGEAHLGGPIILSWDSVKWMSLDPDSEQNVVYHEFAHQLDMLDGVADGTPEFRDPSKKKQWVEICAKEFLELRKKADQGIHTFLDPYGATNEAEFFSVITEHFFNHPNELKKFHPSLYQVLSDFYSQSLAD